MVRKKKMGENENGESAKIACRHPTFLPCHTHCAHLPAYLPCGGGEEEEGGGEEEGRKEEEEEEEGEREEERRS